MVRCKRWGDFTIGTPQQYVKLNGQTTYEDLFVNFAPADESNTLLPFVGLAVVYTDDGASESPHPLHTMMACFVEMGNA